MRDRSPAEPVAVRDLLGGGEFRLLIGFVVSVLAGIILGGRWVLSWQSPTHVLLGLVAIVGAVFVGGSYAIRFIPRAVEGDWWKGSASRRVLRLSLKHVWWVYLGAVGLAALALRLLQ